MKIFKILLGLAAVLLCATMAVGQSTCPSGYEVAQGFKIQNPSAAIGTYVYPMCVSVTNGRLLFQGALTMTGDHLSVNTVDDSKQVRINSRNFTQVTGDSIGFQVKPAQSVSTAGALEGGEISPRLNSGVAAQDVRGLHVDIYLKGTAAGTVSNDLHVMEIEAVTDDAGTRTIGGNVTMLRFRAAFSATTIAGTFVPIRIEKAETQTNSKQFDAVLELPSTNGAVWGEKGSDYTPSQPRAKIKVLINGTPYWLIGYAVEPT